MGRRPTGISAKQTPADSRLAGVCLCCTNFTLPTGALDSAASRDILVLLEKINAKYGTTMLIVTHNNAIRNMVDQVIFLKDGQVRKNYLNAAKVPAADLEDL